MAEMQTSTMALAKTIPPVADCDGVELRLLYDVFAPETVEVHRLEYRDGASLSDYLGDLPEDAEFMIFHNGDEVELEDASKISVSNKDRIAVAIMPLGGGVKNVLRVVMQVAMIGVMFIPGLNVLGAVAISMGLGLINAFLLTPKPPKSQDSDERSYGIDGPKNSATEGIPYPIVYGEFRVAGNFCDSYTENVGDDQYLYLRTVLSDGEIESVSDIEVNEQPITNFTQVQTDIRLGTLTETVNKWFPSSIQQINKGIKLGTAWTQHTTTQDVDRLRFDFVFPAGLVEITEKKGKKVSKSVTLQMEYQQVEEDGVGGYQPVPGSPGWTPLPTDGPLLDTDGDGLPDFPNDIPGLSFNQITAKAPTKFISAGATNPAQQPKIQAAPIGTEDWEDVFSFVEEKQHKGYVYDTGENVVSTGATPYGTATVNHSFAAGTFKLKGVNGAVVENVKSYPDSGSDSVTFSDRRTRAIRKSFSTQQIDRGIYQVRVRRTNVESTNDYIIDEVHLADIAEIQTTPVALRGTANMSLRIKLDEQLNAIPKLTCKVKGALLQEYDREGNPTVKRWSANPAWIGLDILCGVERGAGFSLDRIDWPRWIEFAEYCDANNLTFNGVFAQDSNVGDVLNQVLRIGHAAPIPFGTKISVAIDNIREPVTVFTQAGIIEKSFRINYLPMQDRANEFEVTYYDKSDRNKAKTIRYVDPKAVTFNEVPRSANVSLIGVDNIDQARAELWRMIYSNRLIIRTITFDAWTEAVNLNIGDVALIQHDMMEWANSGRLKSDSTTTSINLDQRVETEVGETYSALVHFSALNAGGGPIFSIVGKKVLFDSAQGTFDATTAKGHRMVDAAGNDYEIVHVEQGSPYWTFTLAETPTGFTSGETVDIMRTDVVVEKEVASIVQNADNTTTVNLASALEAAPDEYANFVFGKVVEVNKPYVLTGMTGTGIEKRKLSFAEYHEGVYAAPEVDIPIPVTQINDRAVSHVTALMFDYERLVPANKETNSVKVTWNKGDTRTYAGADVYMRLNGSQWSPVGSVANVTEFSISLTAGDDVEFMVVAYNQKGDRAPISSAPSIEGTIDVVHADLDAPLNFAAAPVEFQVDGTVEFTFDPPVDATGVAAYQIQYKKTADAIWTNGGEHTTGPVRISGITTGNYDARVRSVSPTSTSLWETDTFTVIVTPGSIMSNFNSGNDRNGDAIPAPTLPAIDPVQHTVNTDGSADLSIDWLWGGDEATIDGFEIAITGA